MSKTIVLALLIAAIHPAEAKLRPLYPGLKGTDTPLVKSHQRKVREPLV
jgi:hypothetical protein